MLTPTNHSILILEDELLLTLDLQDSLGQSGYYKAIACNSIETAFGQIRTSMPDLALLDLNLGPGRSSVLVAMHLKRAGCPFAFMTSYIDNSIMSSDEFRDVPVFQKPVDMDEVVGWVNDCLTGPTASHTDGGEHRSSLHS